MTGPAAVELRHLTKDFAPGIGRKRWRALDDVTLSVAPGEFFGLLGPNGSGKSTALKLLLDLLWPTRGEGLMFGIPCTRAAARAEVGYLPEFPHFPRHLGARELLHFHGGLCGLRGERLRARTEQLLRWSGLDAAGARPAGAYSKGMLQRLGLVQALVPEPRLLLLDEPLAGLDRTGREEMMALLLQLRAAGATIVMVSHELEEIERHGDRVAVLHRGHLVWEGRPDDLPGRAGRQSLTVDALQPEELAELEAWLGARGHHLREVGAPRADLGPLLVRTDAGASGGRADR
mgnify:CR=1 FL=1